MTKSQLVGETCNAGQISARPIEARNQANFNRILGGGNDDRDRRRRRLCCQRGRVSAERDHHGDPTPNQIICQRGKAIVVIFCPTIFERDVSALSITDFAQPFADRRQSRVRRIR
jgi:hypothetical protein